ncbi:MAG: MerR family transcriptional regulator [Bacteroidota bacterium]
MKTYSIRDIERLTGIKAHTLRMWEQRYNLLIPHRTDTNIRYYDDHQLKLLLNVSLLLANGFKISKVSSFSEDQLIEKVKETYRLNESSQSDLSSQIQINGLVIAMLDFDEVKFEKIFSTSILRRGVERTLIEIIFPFLNRMSIMWRIGEMDSGQEHFMYYLIRQKIIVAIDAIPIAPDDAEKFLLFLPEQEYRDIMILLYMYMLKTRDKRIINLGQDLSIQNLNSICEVTQPDVLMTFFTSPSSSIMAQQYLTQLSGMFPDKRILVSGYEDMLRHLKLPNNVRKLVNLKEFIQYLDTEFISELSHRKNA